MEAPLLQTKLYIPTVRGELVSRPRLNERLSAGVHRKLTLVSAPAGFGKTTCIGEWVQTLGWPVAWLSLDPADDDPGRFFVYLVAALQQVDTSLGQEIEGVLHSGQLPPGEVISTTLVNDILGLNGRFLLVLDDFQVIQDRGLEQEIVDLLRLPAQDFFGEVAQDEPVAATQGGDETG